MKDDTPIGDAAMAREATERPDEPAYGPAEASTASRTDGSIDRPANVPPTIWSTAADALEDEARPWSAAKGSEVEAPDTPAPEPASASVARAPSRRGAPAVVARSLDGRLARLHLRGSSITLARAELETMAGLGTLDREALADLAEARWRSGDLVGGGEAARAHLDAGGTEPLAMVVVAEALAAEGRTVEARQIASRVTERAPGLIDRLFAGQARSSAWANLEVDPSDREEIATWGLLSGGQDVISPGRKLRRPRPDDQIRDAEGRPIGARHIAPRAAGTLTGAEANADRAADRQAERVPTEAPHPTEASHPADASYSTDARPAPPAATSWRAIVPIDPPSPADAEPGGPRAPADRGPTEQAMEIGRIAGRELGAIEDAIGRSETASIATRLALLLRLDRALAPVILSLADRAAERAAADDPELAALHLVRGDAYQLIGREVEALAAFDTSRVALGAATKHEEPR